MLKIFSKQEFDSIYISQRFDSFANRVHTSDDFLFYTVTPVLLKSDTNKDCIDHLLYEIPIAVDDDEQEQLMLNQINTILHQLLRLTRTEINKILPLESFEDYYEIKLIIPFCQTLKKYINNTQLSDDEIMFFTADLLQLVTMCIDHNRVGIFFFDDLYIRRDPSSPIPSVYVSPLLYLLPILHKYIYEDVTLTAIPPDGYADANLNETTITWSLGVVVHQLVTGLNPFNSNYPNELIMNQKDNINQFYQIAIQQLLTAPQRMSPLDIQTLPLFQTCLNYKYFNSSDIRNYKPIQHLGKGMTGIVFSAETTDNQIVAIKESKESAFPIMFREARVSRLCDHPNIVRFIDFCTSPTLSLTGEIDPPCVYFVMEYCDFGTLDDYVKFYVNNNKRLSMPELQHFIKQIIEGMWYMYYHKHLIHRDLKLENFLLCQSPPNLPLLKIGDFGFSRCIGDNQMQTFQGTLHFASPEILRQQIYSSKCDLYSLGITLYKMATGTFPSNNDPNYSGNVDVFPCYIQNDHTFDLFCDLVKKLTLEEHERPDWNEFLNHPFVLNILEGSIVYQELEKFIADKMNALPNNENKSFF